MTHTLNQALINEILKSYNEPSNELLASLACMNIMQLEFILDSIAIYVKPIND